MALPPEYLTDEMVKVREAINRMTPKDFTNLPSLRTEDHALIGNYIQNYNFIDLNMRRSIEIFSLAKMIAPATAKKYPKFQDAELVAIMREVISGMQATDEDISQALEKLQVIDYGRTIRNLMGHFAAKRFPGKEIFIFASKDEKDALRVFGRQLKPHGVITASADLPKIRQLAEMITQYSLWLAHKVPEWDERYLVPSNPNV